MPKVLKIQPAIPAARIQLDMNETEAKALHGILDGMPGNMLESHGLFQLWDALDDVVDCGHKESGIAN